MRVFLSVLLGLSIVLTIEGLFPREQPSSEEQLMSQLAASLQAGSDPYHAIREFGFFAALLLDPRDIHMCGPALAEWAGRDPDLESYSGIFLTRPPTSPQSRQLARYRLRSVQVLSLPERQTDHIRSPTELIVTWDHVLYWELGTSPDLHSKVLPLLRQPSAKVIETALSADPQILDQQSIQTRR
jgi:uncharacterized protein YjeT (DUF2065 family)